MSPQIKNIIAVIIGIVIGSIVNMGIVVLGPKIIAAPQGLNITTEAGLKAAMPFMEPKHFLFPFLAHAMGSFSGSSIATIISTHRNIRFAMIISGLFFVGGLMMIQSLPGTPVWFSATDLLLAYFPMGWLGWKLAIKTKY